MGKALVAEGLGVTVLQDYSVIGDPLHRAGLIVPRGPGLLSDPEATRDLSPIPAVHRVATYD